MWQGVFLPLCYGSPFYLALGPIIIDQLYFLAHFWAYFFYLGLEVNVGRGHLGNLEDADGQWYGTQDKQTIVDQDPGQDCMSDTPITGDVKVINLRQSSINTVKTVLWGLSVALLCEDKILYYRYFLFTLVTLGSPELLALTMHKLNSPPRNIYWDTGRTTAGEPCRERERWKDKQ